MEAEFLTCRPIDSVSNIFYSSTVAANATHAEAIFDRMGTLQDIDMTLAVSNVTESKRLEEECGILTLRIAKVATGKP